MESSFFISPLYPIDTRCAFASPTIYPREKLVSYFLNHRVVHYLKTTRFHGIFDTLTWAYRQPMHRGELLTVMYERRAEKPRIISVSTYLTKSLQKCLLCVNTRNRGSSIVESDGELVAEDTLPFSIIPSIRFREPIYFLSTGG